MQCIRRHCTWGNSRCGEAGSVWGAFKEAVRQVLSKDLKFEQSHEFSELAIEKSSFCYIYITTYNTQHFEENFTSGPQCPLFP